MEKFRMPLKSQLEGIQKALKSPKTPKQFRVSLAKRAEEIKKRLQATKK
jgi:hypothetical protein